MNRLRTLTLIVAAVLAPATAGFGAPQAPLAQGSERSGYSYLSYVGSDVSLVSDGEEDSNARVNMPVMPGDRLTTGAASRAEAVLADGNVLRVDVKTDVRLERLARTYEADDDRDLLFLERGTIAVETRYAATRSAAIRVDTQDATILFPEQGLFRVDGGRRGTEIYVLEGRAEVNARSGRAIVRAGEWAWVSGDEEIDVDVADFPRDRFTRFVTDRREGGRRRGETLHVPAEYEYDYYANDLDDYGSWVYVSSYNRYCWRPRTVADWSPYSQGYWRWTPGGLTWVSYEPWGWMPYHYGSWFADASFGWCWLPGSVYSPAWVYWSYTPSWVGWCPVGYYGNWYHDRYYRSARTVHGYESPYYPHLRGRVNLVEIDRRGWNFVSPNRLAGRLDPRADIVRGDRLRIGREEIGVIATTPLRIDRAANTPVATSVREAVRRVPVSEGVVGSPERMPVDRGLTGVLRREARPSAETQETLRRSAARVGHDPAYRPVSPEGTTSAGPRRLDGPGSGVRERDVVAGPGGLREPVGRRLDFDRERGGPVPETGREAAARPRSDTPSGETPLRREGVAPRGDDGWRAPSSPGSRTIESVTEEPRRTSREDSGWRAPAPERRVDDSARGELRREAVSPRTDVWRSTERPEGTARTYEAPRRDTTPYRIETPRGDIRRESPSYEPPRREAPAPRQEVQRYESPGPRYEPPARRYEAPAPRHENPTRRYEAPAPRYEAPSRRYEAPAPRYEAPAPRYEAPSRSAPAPRYEAPRHSAPAPRYEAPSRSAPAPAPAPHREAPPSRVPRNR